MGMDADARRTRDAWLALRCQSGEAGAFRELVGEMGRPLLYFLAKLVGDEDRALDVLQQVWMRAFRAIRRLERPEYLRPWLYQVARGLALDDARKRASVARVEREFAQHVPEAGPGDEPAFDREDAGAVHRALDRLDLRLREVLVLHFLQDVSLAEAAEIIGCPVGTVKSRLRQAKHAPRRALSEGER